MLTRDDFKVLGFALIPSLLIFIIFSIVYDTPLIYDDYRYLNSYYSGYFEFSHIGPFITRSPLFAVILYTLLNLGFLDNSFWFFLNLFFVFHVLTVGLVILYMLKSTGLGSVLKEQKYRVIIIASIAILSLFPNFLELVLWPSAAPFFIGGFLMALGLFSRNYFLKAFLFLCSYSIYETFIIPSLILALIPNLIKFGSETILTIRWKIIFKEIAVFLSAFLVFCLVRLILGSVYGDFEQLIEMPSSDNFKRLLGYLCKIKFHSSLFDQILEACLLLILFMGLVIRNPQYLFALIALFILMIVSGLHDLVIPYDALRVVYGSFLIRCGIVAFAIILSVKYFYPYLTLSVLSLLYIAYIPSHVRAWEVRTFDAEVLKNNFKRIENIYKNSTEPGIIVVGDYAEGLHPKGWVIQGNSYAIFDIIRNKNKIQKPVKLIFMKDDTSNIGFPKLYPGCYLNRSIGKVIPDENSLTGDVVFADTSDGADYLLLSPYMKLDSGIYKASFRLKSNDFPKMAKSEIAGIELVADNGTRNIGGKILTNEDFSNNEYRSFAIDFTVNKPVSDFEVRIVYKKQSKFFIDYLSVSKNVN